MGWAVLHWLRPSAGNSRVIIGKERRNRYMQLLRLHYGAGWDIRYGILSIRTKYEPYVARVISKVLRKGGSTFIDVGAYIGIHTLNAYRILKGREGSLIVDRSPLEFLQLDSSTNSMFTEACMFKKWALGSIVVNRVVLKTVRIDDLHIPEGSLLIKIDVEGGEMRVLSGAEKTIQSRSPLLLIECHGTYDQVADFLTRHGYRSTKFEGIKSFKGHCYLVAKKK